MKMKLFLLFFVIIKFVGSEQNVADNYHGNLRQWTIKADGKMHIGLHLLKESVKLTFPKVTRFNELLSEIKLYSPNERGKCKDANSLNFNLVIAPKNDIHGEIKVISNRIVANLFETCDGGERPDHTAYASPLIDVNPVSLAIPGHLCYDNINTVPFQIYDKDKTKYFMELQVSGNFDCQPSYMELENIELPEFETNKLNESFAGHEEEYWWKRGNDEMLPDQISFDSEKNVKINLLNSTVSTPHFFRIGIEQPIPTFKFNFGAKCVGAVFEMYLNLKKDCHILIKLNQNGFTFSTPLNQNNNITGALSSLIFDGNQVFVKVASPLSINKYQTCQLSNPSDVPNDQFVLQMAPLENIGDCETAEIILSHSDVVDGIEVLIDRAKIVENTTENATENSTIPSSTDKSAEAKMSWWWYLIFGGIGLFIVVIAILIYIFVVRPRLQNQKKSKTPIVMIESVEDEDHRRITVDTKTAISPELKPQKVQPSKSVPPPINDSGKKLKDNTQIIVGAPAKIVTPKKSNDAKVMAKDATDKNDKDGDKNPTKSIENRTQKSVNPIKFDSNFVRSLLPASAFAAEKFYEDYPIKDDKIDLNKCPSDITITDDFWALFSSFLKADDITELERPNRKHGRQYQYQFIVRDLSKPQQWITVIE
uniref:Uncharacterized protein n=1 Tax=Panagrolaimus superbus TaxID=310955 RepID=A0A914Y077_9BILA